MAAIGLGWVVNRMVTAKKPAAAPVVVAAPAPPPKPDRAGAGRAP
ncbi:MAG: hypothetical protein WDM92_13615 [Caulobacteraceae bacterium]